MKYVCSLITVADVKRAKEFYTGVLGQKISADYGENVLFEAGFAIHQRDHFQSLLNGVKVRAYSRDFELYFEDVDLESVQKTLDLHGVSFVHRMEKQPWGQTVLRFYDPDGNIIEVGEPMGQFPV